MAKPIILSKNSLIESLDFEPIARVKNCGNEYQTSKTNYKNIEIIWEIFFPYNFLICPTDTFFIGLQLPMNTDIKNGHMSDLGYFEENYGQPVFNNLEDAIDFIDDYTLKKQ